MLNLDIIVSNKKIKEDTTGSSSSERNEWPFRKGINFLKM